MPDFWMGFLPALFGGIVVGNVWNHIKIKRRLHWFARREYHKVDISTWRI